MAKREVVVPIRVENRFSNTLRQFTQEMRHAEEATRRGGQAAQGLNAAYGTLQNVMNGAVMGLSITGTIRLAEGLYEQGRAANRAAMFFESYADRLGSTTGMMERLRAVTRGTLDDTTLQNAANSLLTMGLAQNADELERLTNIGVTFAQAMGTDVQTSMENLSLMLANQSYLRLDTLGISSGEVRRLAEGYRQAGLDSSEAFTAAFMDVADRMMPQMAAVADASVTALDRLGTQVRNIIDDMGQGFATSVNTIISAPELITSGLQQQEQWRANVEAAATVAGQVYAEQFMATLSNPSLMDRSLVDSLMRALYIDREMGTLAGMDAAGMAAHVQRLLASAGITDDQSIGQGTSVGLWFQDYSAAIADAVTETERLAQVQTQTEETVSTLVGYWETITPEIQSAAGFMGLVVDNMQDQVRLQTAAGNYSESLWSSVGELATMAQGGNIQFIDPSEVARADTLMNNVEIIYENLSALHDEGVISDGQMQIFSELRDSAEEYADDIERARDAFEDMTLDMALGLGGDSNELLGGMLGGLDLSNMPEQQRRRFANAFGLASGDQTLSGIAYQDVQRRLQALANSGVSPDVVVRRAQQYEAVLANMRTGGFSDRDIADALRMEPSMAARQFGFSMTRGEAAPSMEFQGFADAEVAAENIDQTLSRIPEYGDLLSKNIEAAFNAPQELRVVIRVSEVVGLQEAIAATAAGVTVPVYNGVTNFTTQLVNAITNNGGSVPGATSRGRQTNTGAARVWTG